MVSTAMEEDDAALHAGIIAGHDRALEIWEARYRRRMIAAATRDGMPADDAEQAWIAEALPAVWERAAAIFPRGVGLARYAFGAMRNQARVHLKARAREALSLDTVPPGLMATANSVGPAMSRRRREAVLACLERLSPRDRALVELLYMERVDPEVIAERCGIDVRSVRRAGERARQRIRPFLEEALDV